MAEARKNLGRQLATWRTASGLTQMGTAKTRFRLILNSPPQP